MSRKPYPTDVSDEEWSFAAPYLVLMTQDAPQHEHSLREVFNALRWIVRAGSPWRLLPNEQERAQVFELYEAVQTVTGHTVELTWADQGYTGKAGHDPHAYLRDVLQRLPTQLNSRLEKLLPHRWQP